MDGGLKQPKTGRKRNIKECPNPLFLKWLESWRDEAKAKEAKAKESKLQYVYSKAISSLKKYPLPLTNGAEATILDGVGQGIAKRLDEELERHNRNLQNNVVVDLPDDDITELDFPDLRIPPPPNICVTTSSNVNGTPELSTKPKPKKKRKSSPREYVPVYRSGPYAMMIALLKASERIGYKGYLTKAELQQQAQPYTDTSFTVPEPDSYYTAWSSMSTLVKKGLVMRSGNPARFSLTGTGHELAEKLTAATAEHNTTMRSPTTSQSTPPLRNNSFSPPTTPKTRVLPKPRTPIPTSQSIRCPAGTSPALNTSPEKDNTLQSPYGNPSKDFLASYRYKTSGTEVMPTQLGSLKFWYVGSDGECVEHQDQASVIIDDEIPFGYLIKCRQSELDGTKVKYKRNHSRQSKDGHVFVYIDSESISEQRALSEKSMAVTKKSNVKSCAVTSNGSDSSDDEMLMKPLFERLGVRSGNETHTVPSSKKASGTISVEVPEVISITESGLPKLPNKSGLGTSESNVSKARSSVTIESMSTQVKQPIEEKQAIEIKQSLKEKQPSKEKQPAETKKPAETKQPAQSNQQALPKAPALTSLTALKEINPPNESDASNKVEKIIVPEFELKPGSFEIILCVDFIETTGGSKTTRKEEMVKELRMNGVYFDVRKLNVGDFLWVAREKMLPLPGQLVLPERRELVLDYIVERKRMDDLCSSIKDGRFKEQKFRLLNSGLRHPVYLVEDFGSMNFLSMPAQTLEQAIINTQVGQEFFVKRTRDIKESAAYLTLMTRYLQSVYNDQTLKAIKREDMEYVEVKENHVNTHLMTFQELNDISIKNRVLTIGELFGKQLLQIPGVAAEKVVGILEQYPTLRDLLDAYEEHATEKEKENLLTDIKYGKTQRKIGPSVSKTVYQLYCTKGALS